MLVSPQFKDSPMKRNVVNALPWKRLWKIGKPFWVSEKRWIALAHLVAVLVLLTANAGLSVFINKTAGNFMTAIEQRSTPDFYHFLMVYAGALVVATPIQVFYGYLRTRLALVWRTWLSTSLFAAYFDNRAYYKLLNNKEIDNPDQRMTQDVDSFCNSSVGLFISILDAAVNVVTFVGVLYAISPLLTGTVLAVSAGGSIIVVLIGKALVNYNFQQMKTEADLRFGLAEARREAESIAFYRGEKIAFGQARTRLKNVIDTLMNIMNVNRNIQLFTNAYNMMMPLIPAAIIAPMYFANQVPFGEITKASMAFTIVFSGCTFMINQFGGITSYTAIINRLGSFMEALEDCGIEHLPEGKHINVKEGDSIEFDRVSITTPDQQKVLLKELVLAIKPGASLLITGADGSGKSSILRTIAGIWNSGSGTLTRPKADDMMFLSQNPYMPQVTLREALSYPCTESCYDDARLLQILQMTNLAELPARAQGLDTVQNWRDLLSLSEQQRLSIARIILAKPKYAIIDEGTSALEGDNERLLYSLLTSLGSTIVSAGTGSNLVKYHQMVLELQGDGKWELHPALNYKQRSFLK